MGRGVVYLFSERGEKFFLRRYLMVDILKTCLEPIGILATLGIVVYSAWKQHVVKTNDLAHLQQYALATGAAVHSVLLKLDMQDAANKLHESLGSTLWKDVRS
jgi:hypothetical protein